MQINLRPVLCVIRAAGWGAPDSHICNPLNLTANEGLSIKWDEMMGKSQIHLYLLVSRSSGRRVIIYSASDNWQQFCRAPPIFVFSNLIATQYTLAKRRRAVVNYSTRKRERGVKENKILWNLMAFGSFCLKVIDLGSSFFLHLLFSH